MLQLSPLPDVWVDRVFARMAVRYGAAWTRMWEGLKWPKVQADWCEQLAGLQNRPESLRFGLENLPLERPPTASQFRALCNQAPVLYAQLPLPAVPVNPEGVARVRAAVAGIATRDSTLARWQQRMQARIDRGEIRPTITQRAMLAAAIAHRTACKEPTASGATASGATAPPAAKWAPPGPLPWPGGVDRPATLPAACRAAVPAVPTIPAASEFIDDVPPNERDDDDW